MVCEAMTRLPKSRLVTREPSLWERVLSWAESALERVAESRAYTPTAPARGLGFSPLELSPLEGFRQSVRDCLEASEVEFSALPGSSALRVVARWSDGDVFVGEVPSHPLHVGVINLLRQFAEFIELAEAHRAGEDAETMMGDDDEWYT